MSILYSCSSIHGSMLCEKAFPLQFISIATLRLGLMPPLRFLPASFFSWNELKENALGHEHTRWNGQLR